MTAAPVVYVLDDEPEMVKALQRLLRARGFCVRGFTSAEAFLAHARQPGPACLLLDVAMPEVDGLQVQERLRASADAIPIIFLTGHGDIPMSVLAIKAGAEDFLTKPVDAVDLQRAVQRALWRAAALQLEHDELAVLQQRLASLTPREREVLGHVVAGKMNKHIANDLGTGEQNIKVHRGRMMRKMAAKSTAALVRMAERLGILPPG
jgi:FixJ family two-component response regulator